MSNKYQNYDVVYSLIDYDGRIMVEDGVMMVRASNEMYAKMRARGLIDGLNPQRYHVDIHEVIAVPEEE